MTDFDKITYWKKRATDGLKSNFNETVLMMKNVRATLFHITGQEDPDFQRLLIEIGDTYNELTKMIETAQPKKEEPKIIVPGKK